MFVTPSVQDLPSATATFNRLKKTGVVMRPQVYNWTLTAIILWKQPVQRHILTKLHQVYIDKSIQSVLFATLVLWGKHPIPFKHPFCIHVRALGLGYFFTKGSNFLVDFHHLQAFWMPVSNAMIWRLPWSSLRKPEIHLLKSSFVTVGILHFPVGATYEFFTRKKSGMVCIDGFSWKDKETFSGFPFQLLGGFLIMYC